MKRENSKINLEKDRSLAENAAEDRTKWRKLLSGLVCQLGYEEKK